MSRAVVPPELLDDPATPGVSAVGRPEDIAGAVVYLAANDARFITGAVFNVAGGYPGRPRPGHRPAAGTARGIRRPDPQHNQKRCYEDPTRHATPHHQRSP